VVGCAEGQADVILRRAVRFLDERSGSAPLLLKVLRYLFPDHWSFLLGEAALYAFVVLVGTGVYLTLFFEPSLAKTVYHGTYAPLRGVQMSNAYKSAVHLSFDVKAGLLMRQTHHWAADVFVVAIVVHLMRIFFTGAFRRPRELTYLIGLLMLFVTFLEGYLGYSMVDDLLSGMGLAIGYSVAMSIPVVGANLALLIWGAPYPGDPAFESRMYVAHVFILPIAIGVLISLHLALVALRHHTQFRGARQSERILVGVPTFPGQTPRSLGLMLAVASVLFLLGGLVQINPIWLWGPYEVGLSTNGAQPDWYLGWLIGAMRLVPHFDLTIGDYTVVPNPFWGGALFPLVVLAVLAAWPWAERRLTGDRRLHNLLDRPRDAPLRTGLGAGFLSWVFLVFISGSADRITVLFGLPYEQLLMAFRVAVVVAPFVVFVVVWRACVELGRTDVVEHEREAAEAEARAANA
jgi:quinol---cytochrome-c reductase cytochrome b subunit